MNEALILLVLLWAVLLVPSALRGRTSASPHVTVGGFTRAMEVLRAVPTDDAEGRPVLVPKGAADRIVETETIDGVVTRPEHEDPQVTARRVWFVRLIAGTVASFVLAAIFGGATWSIAVLAAVVTGGYVALLRRWKLQRDQVRSVVRTVVPGPDPAEEAAMELDAAVGHDTPGGVRLRRWEG